MVFIKKLLLMIGKFLGDYRTKYVVAAAVIAVLGVVYCISQLIQSGPGKESVKYEAQDVSAAQETYASDNEAYSSDNISESKNRDELIYVYICGCVNKPGVYKSSRESRVFEIIELAGGVTEDADVSALNFVETVGDGQKIYVPSKDENVSGYADFTQTSAGAKVNINRATAQELMTLPGIGESRANDIIRYRTSKGKFECIEDIMKVSGIKEAAFEKIKDLIQV